MVQTLGRVATIGGASAGGFLVVVGGISLATAANAIHFCLALLILRTLRLKAASLRDAGPEAAGAEHPEGTWCSLRAGLAYAVRHQVIGPLLLVVSVLNLAIAAPLNIGIAMLASTRGWNAGGFSAIVAVFGAGAAMGALSVLKLRPRRRPAAVGLIWVATGSTCIARWASPPTCRPP